MVAKEQGKHGLTESKQQQSHYVNAYDRINDHFHESLFMKMIINSVD